MRMAVSKWLKVGPLAGVVFGALTAATAVGALASSEDAPVAPAASPFGAYLAGRHAQEQDAFGAAASWYEQALRADPQSPELISRTFVMEANEGHFDRALPLAEKALKLDSSDAAADLVLLIDRAKSGDKAGALTRAEALPDDGLHRYVSPLARAWTRMAMGNLPGAEAALHDLDKFDGFAPLEYFQLGLIYDFAENPIKAEELYKKTLAATGQLNWRLADAMANFYQRHGRPDEAAAIYARFVKENPGSELAETVQSYKPAGTPAPLVRTATDGLAEALFDLASVVNRPETIDLALLYVRCALQLQPNLTVAQLLLADILTDQRKPEESLAVLTAIPASSRYSWSAQLRVAANLEVLDRTDQAIAQLQAMAAKEPKWASAVIQLGDLLRGQKRFSEAADAYSEAIKRLKAEEMPPRWSLYYSQGDRLRAVEPMESCRGRSRARVGAQTRSALGVELSRLFLDRSRPETEKWIKDDREGGRVAARRWLYRRQSGLGSLSARGLCQRCPILRKSAGAGASRIRQSTIIWATPIGRAGG